MTKRKTVRSRKAIRKQAKPVKKTVAKSTALVRAKKALKVKAEPEAIAASDARTVVGDGLNVGALGLVEWKPTADELKVMSRPVDPAKVKWRASKKGGPKDVPYYPHMEYTRLFNEAFGVGGWAMVPISKPGLVEKTVTCHYVLHVHGKPVAYAMGEQEYFDNNANQTYGDAFESTMATGMRRCAKRLGMTLELWDRDWKETHFGRRASDKPAAQQRRQTDDQPAASNHDDQRPITDFVDRDVTTNRIRKVGQRQRLWQIKQKSGRSDSEVMTWLAACYNVTRLKDIKRCDYDDICKAIEAPGPLPAPPVHEGEVVEAEDNIPE